jgi:uncharacterized protein with HEPN domain
LAPDRRAAQPLVHGYDAVDQEILWQIVVQDLPPLVTALEEILAEYDAQ